jgi:imidazolonepropionase-like amidohydrolase
MHTTFTHSVAALLISLVAGSVADVAHAQVAVRGDVVYTMSQAGVIKDGVVVITGGKIAAVGRADDVKIPEGHQVIRGKVVVPGLIDAHCTVGVSGMLNQKQDQDQLEHSAPVQPELRGIDAFNSKDPLVAWEASLGVTSVHTGHAPGELISGQTCVVKTDGRPVDESVVLERAAIAATLSPMAQKGGSASPGTRAKMMVMLRDELIKAREYVAKGGHVATPEESQKSGEKADATPSRNLRSEAMASVIRRETPLMVTANTSQDIASVLRLAKEFNIRVILDGAAESYLLIDEIKAAGVPVIIHPTMTRMFGEWCNSSMTTCSKLIAAGVPVSMQGGYEEYVPKSRVVLFEAAQAAANGCTFEQALATITSQPASLLGIDGRVGSLATGKDGDVAIFDGDPFEYTTHCVSTVIEGRVVSSSPK